MTNYFAPKSPRHRQGKKHAAFRPLLFVSLLLLFTLTIGCFASCQKKVEDDETGVSDSEMLTAPATEAPTEDVTDSATEAPTEDVTDSATEAPTEDVTDSATEAPTEPVTETPTETETEKGWEVDTGTFNEGKVTYETSFEVITHDAYPDDRIGSVMALDGTGVDTLFRSDFSKGDPACGGNAAPRHIERVQIRDGYLYMPFDESSPTLTNKTWTTWGPVSGASMTKYKQTQFTVDWTLFSDGATQWTTGFLGCYVTNYAGKIPNEPGDGLWFSFQKNSSKVTVYHPDQKNWPAGFVSIPVEKGLLDGEIQVNLVCLPDFTTLVYLTPENGTDARLICRVNFEDGKIRVYNETETLVKESDCTTDSLKGDHFVVFAHCAGVKIKQASILAASKGSEEQRMTITAKPEKGHSLGLDITDKTDLVSICYSVWFNAILGEGSEPVTDFRNISEVLAGKQEWGPYGAFHYWAKPALGYYRSSDKEVLRTHLTQLYEAGVDIMIVDQTNSGDSFLGTSLWNTFAKTPLDALCDTVMEMRAEGKGTPYLAFWSGDSEGPFYQALYDSYYSVEKWQDCFVYWDGKPLLLTTHKEPKDFPIPDLFTVKTMWGLGRNHSTDHWSFLNINNYGTASYDKNGKPEQVSVAVASQETYMTAPTAHGRQGGMFWYMQWYYAFETHPKIVTLTWWNEWTAQRLKDRNGQYVFTDNYNQEYSRDIEPMEGGHGDQYYQWMKQYISAYKGHQACPVLVEDKYQNRIKTSLETYIQNGYKPQS